MSTTVDDIRNAKHLAVEEDRLVGLARNGALVHEDVRVSVGRAARHARRRAPSSPFSSSSVLLIFSIPSVSSTDIHSSCPDIVQALVLHSPATGRGSQQRDLPLNRRTSSPSDLERHPDSPPVESRTLSASPLAGRVSLATPDRSNCRRPTSTPDYVRTGLEPLARQAKGRSLVRSFGSLSCPHPHRIPSYPILPRRLPGPGQLA